MSYSVKTLKEIINIQRKEALEGEKVLYITPYKEFNLSVPQNSKEVGLMLSNVFVAVKTVNGKFFYDLFDKDGNKIATTDNNHRMKLDRDLLEDTIQNQINAIEEAGFSVAAKDSIDKKGRIETYVEMIGRELVVLNQKQEEKYQKELGKKKGEQYLEKASREQTAVREDEDLAKAAEDAMEKQRLAKDLGVNIHKITRIDDNIFFRNNPQIGSRYAYAVLTDKGEAMIVNESDGKYVKSDGFENSSNEAGRTSVARNDETNIDTKNTYGAIYSKNHPNLRYTLSYGQYGEIDLLEQVGQTRGSKIEESDRWTSREVETHNTDYNHINREGIDSTKNITARAYDMNSNNKDAAALRNGAQSNNIDAAEMITSKKDKNGEKGFDMDAVSQSKEHRIEEALQKVEDKFKDRGVKIDDKDRAKIQKDMEKLAGEKKIVFDNDNVEKYCNFYEKTKDNKDKNSTNKDVEIESEEKTLENDALENRFSRRRKK